MTTMTKTREQILEEPNYLRREVTEEINLHTGHWARCVANIVDDEAAL